MQWADGRRARCLRCMFDPRRGDDSAAGHPRQRRHLRHFRHSPAGGGGEGAEVLGGNSMPPQRGGQKDDQTDTRRLCCSSPNRSPALRCARGRCATERARVLQPASPPPSEMGASHHLPSSWAWTLVAQPGPACSGPLRKVHVRAAVSAN